MNEERNSKGEHSNEGRGNSRQATVIGRAGGDAGSSVSPRDLPATTEG